MDSWIDSANNTGQILRKTSCRASCSLLKQIPTTDRDHLPPAGGRFVFTPEQIAVDDMSDTQKGKRKTIEFPFTVTSHSNQFYGKYFDIEHHSKL